MKRTLAVIAFAAAATLTAAPAQAETLCVTYDINVNGTGQAGTQCL